MGKWKEWLAWGQKWINRAVRGSYTLKFYELFSITHRVVPCPVDGRSLGMVLGELGCAVSSCTIEGVVHPMGWETYVPCQGQDIAIFPKVGLKQFSSEFITKLNANAEGGVYIKAVEVVENPVGPVVHRFATHSESIVFDGDTYDPIHMQWSGLELDRSMTLPQMGVMVPAANDHVMDWAEEVDIRENDVTFRILHLNLLGDLNAQDQFMLQVQTVTADDNVVVFNCGLNVGMGDLIPRDVMKKSEFPGIPEGNTRILV